MKVLIRNANLIAHTSPFHGTRQDILIENGAIVSIGNSISAKADQVIEIENLHVSCGWTDVFANFCDPGLEYKETVETGCAAAAAGGFTQVMVLPNTQPVISSKGQVEYLTSKSENSPVKVMPVGSVTRNAEGKELSEMYDMYQAGAVAFSDGWAPIQSSGILQKSLEYLLAIDATLIQLPEDKTIGTHGLINEGALSTRMGLLGKPAISEELMVARDIEL
ncbi:MAG: dihydroorotase, partial [Bacteroidota bacterium]|nr:dihydroorotase [Bacteroidota bacterium]